MQYSIEKIRSTSFPGIFFEYIGIQSIYIFYIFANTLIYKNTRELAIFNIGFILNYLLVGFLKGTLKHPRPLFFDKSYGMPSGHAQILSFIATYMYLIDSKWWIIFVIGFIWACIERYVNYKHYISQLFVGTILGISMAVLIKQASSNRIL